MMELNEENKDIKIDDEIKDRLNTENAGDLSRCNLLINYLPQEMNDTELETLFSDDGPIVSAKVVKDKTTKKSLGYGFVKFKNIEDAITSVNKKNGLSVGHKTIKVSFARPSSDEIKNCKIYVANLPKNFSEDDIMKLFSSHGEIIEIRVLKEKALALNKGVAFVQFANKTQCESALQLNGLLVKGSDKCLVVKFAEEKVSMKDTKIKTIGSIEYAQDNQFIYNSVHHNVLPHSAFHIAKDPRFVYESNNSEYAVPFQYGFKNTPQIDWGDVQKYDLNSQEIGMKFYPQNSSSRSKNKKVPLTPRLSSLGIHGTLRLNSLPNNIDVASLNRLFSPYGRVISAQIYYDNYLPDNSKVTGMVIMENIDSAHLAMQALNGAILYEDTSPITITMI